MLSFLPFLARRARLHSPTKGFVLARSNMSSKVVDLTNDDSSSDDGSSVNDVASSTVAAAAAFSRRSNDSGDERGDDDGKGKIIINTFISLYSNLFLICCHLYHSYIVLAIPHCL